MRSIPLCFFFISLAISSTSQVIVQIIPDTLSPVQLITNRLSANGIKVLDIRYEGDPQSIGIYTDQKRSTGFDSGIVICNGLAEQAVGPNGRPNAGANLSNHFFGDPDLNTHASLCDGVILTIEFIPSFDSIFFQYVFASEEYPEFVDKEYSDLFAFFLRQKVKGNSKPIDLAILPDGTPVTIHTINERKNNALYIPNDNHLTPQFPYLEYDGLTVPLTAGARVIPEKPYELKIILADVGDCEYDSGIFLRMNGLKSIRRTRPKKHPAPAKNQAIARPSDYTFLFDENSSMLDEANLLNLVHLADSLRKHRPDSLSITGYSDGFGLEKNHRSLATHRAQSVAEALMSYGLKNVKINLKGKRNARPLSQHADKMSRALNRRVELQLFP